MTGLRFAAVVVITAATLFVPLTNGFLGIPSFLEFGNCAKTTLMTNFDPVKYTGLWFDIESVPNEYQHTKKCVTQNYTWTGQRMNVATRGLTVDDKKVRQSAVMLRDTHSPSPASMLVQAAGVPEAPYQIVDTDYRTFACVYSCLDGYAGFRAEFMWVFGRTPTLPAATINHCYDTFTSMGVDPNKMVPVVQEHPCPYFEKLNQMLAESEQHLLKVVGPAQTSGPTLPPTVGPLRPLPQKMRDNDVQDLLDAMKEDGTFIKDLKNELESPKKTQDPLSSDSGIPAHRFSGREVEASPSSSSATVSATPFILLTLLLKI